MEEGKLKLNCPLIKTKKSINKISIVNAHLYKLKLVVIILEINLREQMRLNV